MSPAPQGRNHCLSEAIWRGISIWSNSGENLFQVWFLWWGWFHTDGSHPKCVCHSTRPWCMLPVLVQLAAIPVASSLASFQSWLSFCPACVRRGRTVLVWVINPPFLSWPSWYGSSQGNGGWDGKFKGAQPKIPQLHPLPCYCYHSLLTLTVCKAMFISWAHSSSHDRGFW